nr:MAG TPA: Type II secretion system, protein F [Caudoviricetes sp.]
MEEAEITKWISAIEQRSKSNSHRLEALERHTEAVNTLATSVAVMAERVETTGEKVDGLCSDVQELKSEPGKRWKSVVERVIYIVVAAVVGFILARLGLG